MTWLPSRWIFAFRGLSTAPIICCVLWFSPFAQLKGTYARNKSAHSLSALLIIICMLSSHGNLDWKTKEPRTEKGLHGLMVLVSGWVVVCIGFYHSPSQRTHLLRRCVQCSLQWKYCPSFRLCVFNYPTCCWLTDCLPPLYTAHSKRQMTRRDRALHDDVSLYHHQVSVPRRMSHIQHTRVTFNLQPLWNANVNNVRGELAVLFLNIRNRHV